MDVPNHPIAHQVFVIKNSIDRFKIYGILVSVFNYFKGGDLVSTEIFEKGEITVGGTGI